MPAEGDADGMPSSVAAHPTVFIMLRDSPYENLFRPQISNDANGVAGLDGPMGQGFGAGAVVRSAGIFLNETADLLDQWDVAPGPFVTQTPLDMANFGFDLAAFFALYRYVRQRFGGATI
jgi:hypothetical protein